MKRVAQQEAVRAIVTDSETSPSQNSPILSPRCTTWPPRQQKSAVSQVCLVTPPTKLPAPSQQLSVRRSPRLHETSQRSVIMRTPTKWQAVDTSSASPHLNTSTPMQQDSNNEASTSGTMLRKHFPNSTNIKFSSWWPAINSFHLDIWIKWWILKFLAPKWITKA